ncbi:unnamed protein product [Urochloa humidicola]
MTHATAARSPRHSQATADPPGWPRSQAGRTPPALPQTRPRRHFTPPRMATRAGRSRHRRHSTLAPTLRNDATAARSLLTPAPHDAAAVAHTSWQLLAPHL